MMMILLKKGKGHKEMFDQMKNKISKLQRVPKEFKYFLCFHHTIILPSTKKFETKHYTLFYHEDFKQTRTSKNCY